MRHMIKRRSPQKPLNLGVRQRVRATTRWAPTAADPPEESAATHGLSRALRGRGEGRGRPSADGGSIPPPLPGPPPHRGRLRRGLILSCMQAPPAAAASDGGQAARETFWNALISFSAYYVGAGGDMLDNLVSPGAGATERLFLSNHPSSTPA